MQKKTNWCTGPGIIIKFIDWLNNMRMNTNSINRTKVHNEYIINNTIQINFLVHVFRIFELQGLLSSLDGHNQCISRLFNIVPPAKFNTILI